MKRDEMLPPESGTDDEKLLPLLDAIEEATGQRLHPSTPQRWRLKGVAGVRLMTRCVGGKRMCSVPSMVVGQASRHLKLGASSRLFKKPIATGTGMGSY